MRLSSCCRVQQVLASKLSSECGQPGHGLHESRGLHPDCYGSCVCFDMRRVSGMLQALTVQIC